MQGEIAGDAGGAALAQGVVVALRPRGVGVASHEEVRVLRPVQVREKRVNGVLRFCSYRHRIDREMSAFFDPQHGIVLEAEMF